MRPSSASSPNAFRILRQERAAGARHDHVSGGAPAQLLGDLVAHGLGSLGIVGPEIHVDEGPGVAVGELRAEAVDVVVGPFHREHDRPVDQRSEHLAGLEPDRDEHEGGQPRLGGVSRDRVGEVSRRGARHRVETELPGLVHGHGNHAILEGPGGVADRVVLEVELPESPGVPEVPRVHQRRHAHVAADQWLAIERQKIAVAPDARGPRCDALARQDRADGGVVVVDLEGAEAVLADVDRALRNTAAALAADEPSDMSHEPGPPGDLSPTQRDRVPTRTKNMYHAAPGASTNRSSCATAAPGQSPRKAPFRRPGTARAPSLSPAGAAGNPAHRCPRCPSDDAVGQGSPRAGRSRLDAAAPSGSW